MDAHKVHSDRTYPPVPARERTPLLARRPPVVHPRDPDTAWVFLMDGSDVWPRTSPEDEVQIVQAPSGG